MMDDFFAELHDPVLEPLPPVPPPVLPDATWDAYEPVPPTAPEVGTHDAGDVVTGVGAPQLDANFWHDQGPEGACAVVAQGSIIEQLTGVPFDQARATAWLAERGWYDPVAGTRPEDLTRLLDAYGIPTTVGAETVTGLYDALAAGRKVMVTLDANEIWHPRHDPLTGAPHEWLRPAGHAVWVTGIEFDRQDGWQVVLNDSGHPDGRASTVALADFLNAWDDYGNLTVLAGPAPTGAGLHPTIASAS